MKAKQFFRISFLHIGLLLWAIGCEMKYIEPLKPSSTKGVTTQSGVQQTPSLTFFQLDIDLDDEVHPLSSWGLVHLSFPGTDELLYFNLVVNDVWRIRNMPVLSEEPDSLQTISFTFDLGVSEGTAVTSLHYAYALSTDVLDNSPTNKTQATVSREDYLIDTGFDGELIGFSAPPAVQDGGKGSGKGGKHKKFTNQEAGNFECVPAALSNSLQWLNTTNKLNIPAADISIAALKPVVGWTPKGVPTSVDWPALKQQYLQNKSAAWKVTITTEEIKAPENPADNAVMNKALQQLKKGCDLELDVPGHEVAITGIQKLQKGIYSLDLTHDTIQGANKEGAITEKVTYDTETRKFTGGPAFEGKSPKRIVAECVQKKHNQGGGQ